MYIKDSKLFVYVCPYCYNKLETCTCERLPETLIQIDKKIWKTIKLLNDKGYHTEACCEGHPVQLQRKDGIYIMFKKSHKNCRSIPAGFSGSLEEGVVYANITGKSIEAMKRKQRSLLKDLHLWAESL